MEAVLPYGEHQFTTVTTAKATWGVKFSLLWQVKRFMPFLEGNRQCIGMSLAKLNTTTATALLLSHFTFRLADDVNPNPPSTPAYPLRSCLRGLSCC